jgi:hypothetical protein
VVLYIASHGYADPYGNFYVIPYHTGESVGVTEPVLNYCFGIPGSFNHCAYARTFLNNSTSSDELIVWCRSLDAGMMVMILDSCHSAGLPGRDFKPGPLGDRTFGQLAYDKRMMILAATQRKAISTPRRGIKGTLLSSALISISNANPQLTLSEWLERAEDKVPELYNELYPEIKSEDIQLPVLLDFTKFKQSLSRRPSK